MRTHHKLIFDDAENMKELEDKGVHLVVTSPLHFNALLIIQTCLRVTKPT